VTISGNCEGEKDVHTLTELGFTATTWPGGALSTHAVDWSPLAGKKRVILWPDNDEPGMKAMVGAAAALRALADPPLQLAQVNPQWIGLGDVAEDHGKDVTDFLAELCPDDSRDTKRTILREILDRQVESLSAVGDLLRRIESIASGARRPLRMTFGALGKLTQMLIPGTVSLICGQPGARKSFFINQLSLDFYEKGVKMATLALEEDVTYHTTRSLAQVSGTANMTEEQWIFDHAAQAHALTLEWKDFLDGYARTITDSKEGTIAYSKIIDWVRRKIASGARVLIVDPLTSAEPDNDEPVPKADKKLILLLKKIAVEAEVSIVLVTHPRDGADKMPYGDRMAGGAAFKRFCQTQLFLEMHPEPLEGLTFVGDSLVRQQDDSDPPVTNTVHITKARNGRGTGMKIAFHFDPATLCFRELGVVREDKKKKGRWQ
jgi:KaiC/GvpD/RAD55 family RecA-like ATPase